MIYDVAIVGGGPAGSTCAAFCAGNGLRAIVLEREKFPREKVCGDTLNPACWPILDRLNLRERILAAPHARLDYVEFISRRDRRVRVNLPRGKNIEIGIKRRLFDSIMLDRAREAGAEIFEVTTVSALNRAKNHWEITTTNSQEFRARVLVAADGRNSTVARLLGLLPRPAKERVALQTHVPLPCDFGNRVVLQWLPGGYSGQAPSSETELNVCLVGKPQSIRGLQNWATKNFALTAKQNWRTIAPLRRAALAPAGENLLFIGDAACVVEPFTGEGIFYALRSGEIASAVARKMLREDPAAAARDFLHHQRAMYSGRLWVNRLARTAVVSSSVGSLIFETARWQPRLLRYLTSKVVSPSKAGTL